MDNLKKLIDWNDECQSELDHFLIQEKQKFIERKIIWFFKQKISNKLKILENINNTDITIFNFNGCNTYCINIKCTLVKSEKIESGFIQDFKHIQKTWFVEIDELDELGDSIIEIFNFFEPFNK